MEVSVEGTPRSVDESSAASTNSPFEQDTPATDISIVQDELPEEAPKRKLSYSDHTAREHPPLSFVKGPDWPTNVPSIWALFVEAATKFPDALAVASTSQKGELFGLSNLYLDHELYRADPYVRWSYAEFVKGIVRLVRALQKQGVGEGSLVFIFVHNSAQFLVIFWAVVSLGCYIVPIHPRNLLNKEEAAHILTKAISASQVKKPVVFAQTGDVAKQVLGLNVLDDALVVVVDGDGTDTARPLHDFITHAEQWDISSLARYKDSAAKWAFIIFTSGTTSLPKGVVQVAARFDKWIENRRQAVPVVASDSCFLTIPANHAFYPLTLPLFHGCGAAVVIPGPSFTPQTAPEVFSMEKCTHSALAPTMVYALSQIAKERDFKFTSLKSISCGGSRLSRETITGALQDMGSQAVEVIYASTEAGPISSSGTTTTVDELDRNGDITVGKATVGSTIKVCAPGEIVPLPRNTEGELHFSCATICDGYVDDELPSTFYTDEDGQRWMVTGDAAMIDDNGLIFVVGRVKDMIIRGGVNISPAAIEFALASEPATEKFGIQIVGRPDVIAGEVPIAVSAKSVTLADIDLIQDTILRHMGPIFLPEEILTLQQIGLADFPKTMLGKAQKSKLKRVVEDFLEKRDAPVVEVPPVDELTSNVQKIWSRIIGHGVDVDAQVTDYADSISIMRVRDRLAKDMGVSISLAEMLDKKTARDHIELIRQQKDKATGTSTAQVHTPVSAKESGILTHRDIIHLASAPHHFPATKAHISDEIAKAGLAWEDVQEITPASDFTQIMTQGDIINTSWTWKFAVLANSGINKEGVRRGIEVMLANNPMLASFLCWNKRAFGSDIALHVMFEHTQKLFDQVFRDYGVVQTKEDFANLVNKPYEYEMAQLPGLLVQFLLFDVAETGLSGAIMVGHHAPFDASHMQLIFDDLDKALGGATTLDQHTSYKTWADSFYSLRNSLEARIALNWQLNRLSDLSSLRTSVFPALPRPPYTTPPHIQSISDNGHHTTFHARGITALKRAYPSLTNPTIIKSAWSLLNMHHTNTNTALFSNLQADRKRFPFIPAALDSLAPPGTFSATNVAGPTLQDVVNIIPLHPLETPLEFMTRIAADQENLSTYASAPLRTLLSELGPIDSEIMLDILRSQCFNWTPGLGAMAINNPNENYEAVSSFIRPSLRLVINVDVGGVGDETVFAQIKSPLMDGAALEGLARDLEGLVLWLCEGGNWGRRMGEWKGALRGLSGEDEHSSVA
ncbi:putative NRPS-like protein biosynthetic cluster [Knufia fluminis]|uniref:NRPS-like protein biosynthetic cluster n=1 Tax=Knufia fluminis TaxID=191047 RepID=A0AAN8EDE7_9EURO|nr:putative NRPS-like protein biosynthetic cluster [Knufia fluminis]